jgi:hypothetical protein
MGRDACLCIIDMRHKVTSRLHAVHCRWQGCNGFDMCCSWPASSSNRRLLQTDAGHARHSMPAEHAMRSIEAKRPVSMERKYGHEKKVDMERRTKRHKSTLFLLTTGRIPLKLQTGYAVTGPCALALILMSGMATALRAEKRTLQDRSNTLTADLNMENCGPSAKVARTTPATPIELVLHLVCLLKFERQVVAKGRSLYTTTSHVMSLAVTAGRGRLRGVARSERGAMHCRGPATPQARLGSTAGAGLAASGRVCPRHGANTG